MAPLRSSRSTRNQDHQASRNRPGVVDLDPTEGLPVQKWEQIVVRVNQDPSTEAPPSTNLPSGSTATSSTEWAAQFGTSQFPWPEKPLPSFYTQLSPWNQEMLRRARTGNTNAKLSVWDRKDKSWISAAEAEKRKNAVKVAHLNNVATDEGSKQNNVPDSPAHDEEDDHDEKSDDEMDGEHADDEVGANAPAGIKRRKKYLPEERIFEVKRWVQLPPAVADKTEERKFLADRRPGMPSLYGGTYQNQIFGSMGLNTNGYGISPANANYDLGDGGGLGNASGVLGSAEGATTPVRKNMPPRKKKKKGGPGRKKANPDPVPQTTGVNPSATNGELKLDGANEVKPTEDVVMAEDNDGSESGSEAEGSEEGEIDEAGQNDKKVVEIPEPAVEAVLEKSVAEDSIPHANAHDMEPKADTGEPSINQPSQDETGAEPHTMKDAVDVQVETYPDIKAEDVVMQEDSTVHHEPLSEVTLDIQSGVQVPHPVVQDTAAEQNQESQHAVEPESLQPENPIQEQTDIILPPIEQTTTAFPSQPLPEEPQAETIPGPNPEPIEPSVQTHPAIPEATTEVVEQSSIQAPDAEQVRVRTDESTIQPPTQNEIPEPTSPDLLDKLENELKRDTGEENNE